MKRIGLFEDYYMREVKEAIDKIAGASESFDHLIRTHTRNVKSFEKIRNKLDGIHEEALKIWMRYE